MDDEDGRCLLDVICDPEALNDFLHGSETHLDADDLLDGSIDPSSSFFSSVGGHVPEVQPPSQLSASEPTGLPSGSVDLDFLEDDDILGSSPGGGVSGGREGGSNGFGTDHEPCDILQQSLAEANITEQSLQEAEELDLSSFGLTGLTQVVQTLADPASMTVAGDPAVGVGITVGVGGTTPIFPGPAGNSTVSTAGGTADMLGSVLAHPSLQLQPQVMNKAINVQPFMQQVGLGNVTLQPISGLQALPNGSSSGHLGIGQIQVVGQPTVMTINQPVQPILAKTVGGYQLHQPGTDVGVAGAQTGLSAPVLSSAGGLLIQGGKAALGSPAMNGTGVSVSSANLSSNSGSSTMTSSAGLVGFSSSSVTAGIGAQQQTQAQGQIMQNVIIQRTPTPIQPKPPQGGVIQPKLFKQPQPQPQQGHPSGPSIQNEAKVLGVQQGPVPVSTTQNVAFLTGKASANVVLSTPTAPQGAAYSQALFKQQTPQASGKPVSVHLLNQSSSIVIPSQTVLQGQNPQFLLPQLQAGGQILTQHPGGHIITSQGPGGQLIANQILTTNQNLNLSQVLTPQGQPAHILSAPIQLQPGQMTQSALFQMPVSLGQTQAPTQAVIQGMPIQNPLAMLGQVEGLGPAVSLQPTTQQPVCGLPANCGTTGAAVAPCQPGEGIVVLGSTMDQSTAPPPAPPSVLSVQAGPSIAVSASAPTAPSSSPSASSSSSLSSLTSCGTAAPPAQHSPGSLFLTPQGSSMILSQDSVQMFLQQLPSTGPQQHVKIQSASPSQLQAPHPLPAPLPDTSQPSQASPLVVGQQVQSPHQQAPPRPPSRPSSRSCTPSSLPPLFIVHNQAAGSPQQLTQVQPALPTQTQVPTPMPPQPVTFRQDVPPPSCSPKPPQGTPVQFQIVPPAVGASMAPGVSHQSPVQGLMTEQQQTLHLFGAQLQPLAAITQPLPQQKLQQVQQNAILQSKQPAQLLSTNQFGVKQEAPPSQPVTSSASHSTPAQLMPVLQQASVLVNTQVSIASEVKVFLGSPGPSGVTSTSLAQSMQPKQGVIGSVGGLSLGKGGLHIQVCNSGLAQLASSQAPPSETIGSQRPLIMEPSKEARMLEQLRKQQGSVLHPDYSSPFCSYEDALKRLLPYHLYQGTASSPEDCRKVDNEFESVSSQLLKRTRAMIDKYRLLLFEESRRSGPSAEMVMIDRMFIQEEKVALNQDRLLAKERPDEYVAHSRALESTAARIQQPTPAEPASTHAGPSVAPPVAMVPVPYPAATHITPTKMVIKQGGGTASVTWSSSITAGPATPAARPSAESARAAASQATDDEDALPQRSSKPPIKTYEARRRISLKLKIKQEAGLSKVVHNTALDTVHTPTQLQPLQESPAHQHQQPALATSRTPPPTASASPSSRVSTATPTSAPTQHSTAAPTTASSSFPSSFYSASSSSSSPSAQMNGTLGNHEVGSVKRSPAATVTQPLTTCRLPLRKTYRENVSPRQRPGVPGGGDKDNSPQQPPMPLAPPHEPQGSSSPMDGRTVIASVKLEKHGSRPSPYPPTWSRAERSATGAGAAQEQGSSPGLMKELAEVEEVFYHGMIRNTHHHHSEEEDYDGERKDKQVGAVKSRPGIGKSKERGGGSSRVSRQTPGSSSSPAEPSCTWDSSLSAKRHKLGSPDMDNASFSSGSPPPDDTLNEHLQRAIDDILNLQQGAAGGPAPRANLSQCPSSAPSGPHRPPVPISPSVSQRSQLGDASGHRQNSKLVSRTNR